MWGNTFFEKKFSPTPLFKKRKKEKRNVMRRTHRVAVGIFLAALCFFCLPGASEIPFFLPLLFCGCLLAFFETVSRRQKK